MYIVAVDDGHGLKLRAKERLRFQVPGSYPENEFNSQQS